jgi:hypothetical protein
MWRNWTLQNGAVTMENRMEVSQKQKTRTAIWFSNPTSGYISKKNWNQDSQSDICTPIAGLFTIAHYGNNPRFTDRLWLKWISFINTLEYSYTLRKKGILQYVTTCVGFEDLVLSEISQTQRNTAWFHLCEVSKRVKFIKLKTRMVVVT